MTREERNNLQFSLGDYAYESLREFLDDFHSEEACQIFLESERWASEPVCPFCGYGNPWITNRGYKCRDKECFRKFTVRTGTIFEHSKVDLRTWFAAYFLYSRYGEDISTLELGRMLSLTQKTAWHLKNKCRDLQNFGIYAPYIF